MSDLPAPLPIVILISGRGSNMRNLIERSRTPDAPYRVALVLSDNPGALGLRTARELGVPARAVPRPIRVDHGPADRGPPRGATLERAAHDRLLAAAIDPFEPKLVVLAGFMRILSADFVARYAGRLLNIHPSLLPEFPGLHTHRRVLAEGCAAHGATVHFVTRNLDAGPLILQSRIAVRADDDEATLAARVLAREHEIYPMAVSWFCTGRLSCTDGRVLLDGVPLTAPVNIDEDMSLPSHAGASCAT